jgi:hypothetical protein
MVWPFALFGLLAVAVFTGHFLGCSHLPEMVQQRFLCLSYAQHWVCLQIILSIAIRSHVPSIHWPSRICSNDWPLILHDFIRRQVSQGYPH